MDAELESLEARARDAEALGKEVARLESILDATILEVKKKTSVFAFPRSIFL
jgi:hypothetical protein